VVAEPVAVLHNLKQVKVEMEEDLDKQDRMGMLLLQVTQPVELVVRLEKQYN